MVTQTLEMPFFNSFLASHFTRLDLSGVEDVEMFKSLGVLRKNLTSVDSTSDFILNTSKKILLHKTHFEQKVAGIRVRAVGNCTALSMELSYLHTEHGTRKTCILNLLKPLTERLHLDMPQYKFMVHNPPNWCALYGRKRRVGWRG